MIGFSNSVIPVSQLVPFPLLTTWFKERSTASAATASETRAVAAAVLYSVLSETFNSRFPLFAALAPFAIAAFLTVFPVVTTASSDFVKIPLK